MTSTATAPRPRRSWPMPRGFCCRVLPTSCTMPSVRTRSPTRPWPRPNPPHRDPHALHSGHAGQTIQGPDSPAPADVVSHQSAVAPGDDVAHGHPCPCLEHLRRSSPSPVDYRCSSSESAPLSGPCPQPRRQRLASRQTSAGPWCAWLQERRRLARPQRDAPAGPITQTFLSVGLPRRETTPQNVQIYGL